MVSNCKTVLTKQRRERECVCTCVGHIYTHIYEKNDWVHFYLMCVVLCDVYFCARVYMYIHKCTDVCIYMYRH